MLKNDGKEETILDALTKIARPVIRTEFNADSCIASTRIALDVLAYFGVKAEAKPVMVVVLNAKAAKLAETMTLDEITKIAQGYSMEDTEGPWTMMIGSGRSTRKDRNRKPWSGHLVATIPDESIIIDLSIDQAARPQKGLDPTPYWVRIPDRQWWANEVEVLPMLREDGTALLFNNKCPDPDGYLKSPNWDAKNDPEGRASLRLITGQIIRQMKDVL